MTAYTTTSVSGYNSDPPSDDGSQTANNEIVWAKHKEKLGDPLKTAIEAINTKLVAALINEVGMFKVASQTASSSSAILFDSTNHPTLFNGTYRKVIFLLQTIIPATDDQYMIIRIGTGAGPTIQSGSSAYGWSGWYAGTSALNHTGSGTDSFSTGMAIPRAAAGGGGGLGTGTNEHMSATVEANRLGQGEEARFTWHGQWKTAGSAEASFGGGGAYGSNTAITGVQFSMSSGNIASGTFLAYGVL